MRSPLKSAVSWLRHCYLNTGASLSVGDVDNYVTISNVLDFIFNTFPLFLRLWKIRILGRSVCFGPTYNLDLLHVRNTTKEISAHQTVLAAPLKNMFSLSCHHSCACTSAKEGQNISSFLCNFYRVKKNCFLYSSLHKLWVKNTPQYLQYIREIRARNFVCELQNPFMVVLCLCTKLCNLNPQRACNWVQCSDLREVLRMMSFSGWQHVCRKEKIGGFTASGESRNRR